jgi:hypothetical protein
MSVPYSATASDRTSGIVRWPSVRIPSAPPGSRREPPWVPGAHNPSTIKCVAQHNWLNEIITRFVDRIPPVDAAIATRAGALLPGLTNPPPPSVP